MGCDFLLQHLGCSNCPCYHQQEPFQAMICCFLLMCPCHHFWTLPCFLAQAGIPGSPCIFLCLSPRINYFSKESLLFLCRIIFRSQHLVPDGLFVIEILLSPHPFSRQSKGKVHLYTYLCTYICVSIHYIHHIYTCI